MPTYNLFWDRNYKKIGNCCMTQELEYGILLNEKDAEGNDKGAWDEQYVDMIDVGWMNQEKMKWIGWDKQGYCAWITPRGMIYRFKDLKRNEAGIKWEKDEDNEGKGEMHLQGDGELPPNWPRGHKLYVMERDAQENCAFCHDRKGGYVPGSDREGGAGGGSSVTDSEGAEGGGGGGATDDDADVTGTSGVAGTDETTYTGDVTYTPDEYAQPTGGYGDSYTPDDITGEPGTSYAESYTPKKRQNDYIPPLPYSPPVQLPTNVNTYTPGQRNTPAFTPKFPDENANPVLNTNKVTAKTKVTDTTKATYTPFKTPIPAGYRNQPDPIDNLRVKPNVHPLGVSSFMKQPNQNPIAYTRNNLQVTPISMAPGLTNNSSDTFFVKPDNIVLKSGRQIGSYDKYKREIMNIINRERKSQNLPTLTDDELKGEATKFADNSVLYWDAQAVAVPPGSKFFFPIDGITKRGMGYVIKVIDANSTGARVDKNGNIKLVNRNTFGGKQTEAPDYSWDNIIDASR